MALKAEKALLTPVHQHPVHAAMRGVACDTALNLNCAVFENEWTALFHVATHAGFPTALPQRGPAGRVPFNKGRDRRIVGLVVVPPVHVGVEQSHPGDANRKFLRRFHFGLGEFFNPALLDGHAIFRGLAVRSCASMRVVKIGEFFA